MGNHEELSTAQCLAALVTSVVLLSGCMGFAEEGGPKFELSVEVDTDYGLILTSFEDGEQTGSTAPRPKFRKDGRAARKHAVRRGPPPRGLHGMVRGRK